MTTIMRTAAGDLRHAHRRLTRTTGGAAWPRLRTLQRDRPMNRHLTTALLAIAALGLAAGCSTPAAEGPGSAFPPTPTSSTEIVMPTEQAPLTGTAPAEGPSWMTQYGKVQLDVADPVITENAKGQYVVVIHLVNNTDADAFPSMILTFTDPETGADDGTGLIEDQEASILHPGQSRTITATGGKYRADTILVGEMTTYLP